MCKKFRAQASLEYLITYGWALVSIIIIVGALVMVTSSGINENTCTSFMQFICKGIGFDEDTLILVLQNATGREVTINPFRDIAFDGQYGYAIIVYKDGTHQCEDVTISPGDEFTIRGIGRAFSDSISLNYYEQETGITRDVSSGFASAAPEETPTCFTQAGIECTIVWDILPAESEGGETIVVNDNSTRTYTFELPLLEDAELSDYDIVSATFVFNVIGAASASNSFLTARVWDPVGNPLGQNLVLKSFPSGLNTDEFTTLIGTQTLGRKVSFDLGTGPGETFQIASTQHAQNAPRAIVVIERT